MEEIPGYPRPVRLGFRFWRPAGTYRNCWVASKRRDTGRILQGKGSSFSDSLMATQKIPSHKVNGVQIFVKERMQVPAILCVGRTQEVMQAMKFGEGKERMRGCIGSIKKMRIEICRTAILAGRRFSHSFPCLLHFLYLPSPPSLDRSEAGRV